MKTFFSSRQLATFAFEGFDILYARDQAKEAAIIFLGDQIFGYWVDDATDTKCSTTAKHVVSNQKEWCLSSASMDYVLLERLMDIFEDGESGIQIVEFTDSTMTTHIKDGRMEWAVLINGQGELDVHGDYVNILLSWIKEDEK